jgi:membrane protease YdiL (CAAX protease family)
VTFDDAEIGSAEVAKTGLVLAVGGLALAPLALVIARRLFPGRNVFFARWRFFHVFAAFAVVALCMALVPSAVPHLELSWPELTVQLVESAVALGAGCAMAFWFAARLDPTGVRSLGFASGGTLRACAAGATSYMLMLPALYGLELLWPWVITASGGEFRPQEVAVEISKLGGGALAAAIVLGVIVQPFLEELLFRAFLQPLLVQNLGDRGGVALTALLFGALHGDSAFLPIFALALLLGAIMLRTQRLAAVWLVHALHNGLMFALIFADPESAGALPRQGGLWLVGLWS